MSSTALFVGNLPFNASSQGIYDLFRPYCPISVAFASGRNFAYVEVHADQAEKIIRDLDGHCLNHHEISVKLADYREPRTEVR